MNYSFICGDRFAALMEVTQLRWTLSIGTRINCFAVVFEISQSTKDLYILEALLLFFGCGYIISDKKGLTKFKISNLKLIHSVAVLPFLFIFSIIGFKRQQYDIWIKAVTVKLPAKLACEAGILLTKKQN